MASGNSAIVLQSGVDFDNFERIAEKWAQLLSLDVLKRAENPFERIWDCRRQGLKFWLSWDENSPDICLEPQDADAGAATESILKSLEKK